MPKHTTVAAEHASELAHPLRYRLIATLADGPRTEDSLAAELDVPVATIRGHAVALEAMDVLQATEVAGHARTYELGSEPIISDADWGRLPLPTRRSVVAAAVTDFAARASATVDRGGFDREDMHLTRTAIRVDEARWQELARLLGGTLQALGDLAEAPDPDGSTGQTFQANAVMMLFAGEQADTPAYPTPSPLDEEDALRRTWELSEELEAIVPCAATDWGRIHDLADELRLIARSMQALPRPPAE